MLTSKLFMIRKKFVAGQREKLENPKTIGFFSKEIITTLKLINNGLSVYSKYVYVQVLNQKFPVDAVSVGISYHGEFFVT